MSIVLYDNSSCAVQQCTYIGVDLGGGSPGKSPPIIEKRPCIYHFLPRFASQIFWFAHPIFLTSLCQCVHTTHGLILSDQHEVIELSEFLPNLCENEGKDKITGLLLHCCSFVFASGPTIKVLQVSQVSFL